MNEKIIFTVCTANYLAQARSLGDSVLKTNPGYKFIIGLVDKVDNRFDRSSFHPHTIIEVETLAVPGFDDMRHRYSLLELTCALKPWFALHIFKNYAVSSVIYMDTDILVLNSLNFLEQELVQHSILLTPHINSPLPADGKRPHESAILKTGIYNAGFFAVKNDNNGIRFLNWWKDILVHYCYEDGRRGLASDQSWLNFVPLFFENTGILKHPGCNVAYWNLHERNLEKRNGIFFVNKEFPLLFFHFSGYSLPHPELLSKHQDRFTMNDNPAVKELFHLYRSSLTENKHEEMLQLSCYYKKNISILQKLGLRK